MFDAHDIVYKGSVRFPNIERKKRERVRKASSVAPLNPQLNRSNESLGIGNGSGKTSELPQNLREDGMVQM